MKRYLKITGYRFLLKINCKFTENKTIPMKTIFFVRHGKAAPAADSGSDAGRMLTDTGVLRTYLIANYLIEAGTVLDLLVSSPAERAYTTGLILADKLGIPAKNIIKEEKIFTGDEEDILDLIRHFDDKYNSVLIVGHNPSITHIANRFANPKLEKLPTTGVLSVSLLTEKWSDVEKAEVKQNFVVWPGML